MTEDYAVLDNCSAECWNETFSPLVNKSLANSTSYAKKSHFYIYIGSVFITLCMTAVIVNLFILLSACWIRRPISATLQISLSMTTADSCTLLINVLSVIINSLIPKGLQGTVPFKLCSRLLLEALRFGSYITTFFHVFALGGNHYLGIKRPFHYSRIMTHKNIYVLLFFLWTLPPTVFIFAFYFLVEEDQGFRSPGCNTEFIKKRNFRYTYSSVVSVFIVLIIIIYTHIYYMVRRHQIRQPVYVGGGGGGCSSRRDTYSSGRHRSITQRSRNGYDTGRNGSTTVETTPSHSERRRRCACSRPPIRNKTIYTTILIVGSLVVGWTPAILYFAIVCDDCLLKRTTYTTQEGNILISSFCNFLLITKTALNSYIYAARMQETKDALRRMKARCLTRCRLRMPSDQDSVMGVAADSVTRRSTRISRHSSSRRTVVCHLHDGYSQDQPLINGTTASRSSSSFRTARHNRDDTAL